MGFSETWVTVSGRSREQVLADTGLFESPERIHPPQEWAPRDRRACLAVLPGGTVLLFSHDAKHAEKRRAKEEAAKGGAPGGLFGRLFGRR